MAQLIYKRLSNIIFPYKLIFKWCVRFNTTMFKDNLYNLELYDHTSLLT